MTKPMSNTIKTAALTCLAASGMSSAQTTTASSCPRALSPSSTPVVGAGWVAELVATDLTSPRGMTFDQSGHLLVIEQGKGVRVITLNGSCVDKSETLLDYRDLNHGITLSSDGKTLFVSSADAVYSYSYDATGPKIGSDKKTLVENMSNSAHTSRTLMMSRKANGILLVSRGSADNMDMDTQQIGSGRSQIRSFDINKLPDGKPYDYASQGTVIGWGLRNSVGVAEGPVSGGIWSVENSADDILRNGQDIHQDDPGEELNFHGWLNGSTERQGANFGYPNCFALWGTNIPGAGSMKVGDQFALNPSGTLNDETCAKNYTAPRLTFQAHTAPLDLLFSPDETEAYVTFHGSWNRDQPAGYKLSSIAFSNGQPVDAPDSTTATRDILSNPDLSVCPGNCFRPVGLAMDKQGRIFMSSDATGEIYALHKADMTALGTPTTASTGSFVTSTSGQTPNIGSRSARSRPGEQSILMALAAVALSLVGGAMFLAV